MLNLILPRTKIELVLILTLTRLVVRVLPKLVRVGLKIVITLKSACLLAVRTDCFFTAGLVG